MRRLALLGALLALAGCGGGESGAADTAGRSDRLVDFSLKPPYVNSLEEDADSGELLLTTNRGFFRIDPKTDKVTEQKASIEEGGKTASLGTFLELDTAADGTLVGSGHPDPGSSMPQYLGYLRSSDGGRTWEVTDRYGLADLHKIVFAHDRVYAWDAVLSAMLISDDGGQSFSEHFTPRGLIIDFEVDPDDEDTIVASTDEQLYRSTDGGDSWRPALREQGVRVHWPEADKLFIATKDGRIQVSVRRRRHLRRRGRGGRRALRAQGGRRWSAAGPLGRHRVDKCRRRGNLEGGVPPVRRFLLLLIVLLALPASASAHSLVRPGGGVVSYLSQDATSLNELIVRGADGGRVEFLDRAVDGGIDPGSCAPGELNTVGYIVQVFCPAGPVQRIRVDLGDREDSATITVGIAMSVLAGTGADRVTSGSGADELDGGTGNDALVGGAGNDVIVGGPGADELDGGEGDDRIGASDGEADTVRCGAGTDTVEADGSDTVAEDCEVVTRTSVVPVTGGADEPGPPVLAVGAPVLQRGVKNAVIRVFATASEPATLSASGFLEAGGLQLPIVRLPAKDVTVGGGGVVLGYKLTGRLWKVASKALSKGKKSRVGLSVVATDPGGASSRKQVPRITLQRGTTKRSFAAHPTPDDVDGDEVANDVDNCPTVRNNQFDYDQDGLGDACDDDADGDTVPNTDDNCDLVPNLDQADANGNGYGDACDIDTDGDGVVDSEDNCRELANTDQANNDGDRFGDLCDADRDQDGIDNQYDLCPDTYSLASSDLNGDGFMNDQSDADNDGLGTECDPDESAVTPPPAATPTPTPDPLTAEMNTAATQRLKVIGAGPIVTVRCSAACTVASTLTNPAGQAVAVGNARLKAAGTTFVFLRLRSSARRPMTGRITTALTDAAGATTSLTKTVRLKR